MNLRIGQGYDSHRLGEGNHVIIGGESIPFEKGIIAHSDGDILLHALTDALLGALALGDIGQHFPDTDPRFKNMKSADIVSHVMKLVEARHSKVINVDATLLVEKPKLASYIPKMRINIANLLKIPVDNVSVKAKTNEKMDAVGRIEGFAAYAVVLLETEC